MEIKSVLLKDCAHEEFCVTNYILSRSILSSKWWSWSCLFHHIGQAVLTYIN
jgi:hypothetical protein